MNALTLHQPYATLIAMGAKRIETRNWPAPPHAIGQRLAIHAGKSDDCLHMCNFDPFDEYVAYQGDKLPRGAFVAIVTLKRCAPITEDGARDLERNQPHEFAFGNYDLSDGKRYAWVLDNVTRIHKPVPHRGYQRLWRVDDQIVHGIVPPPGETLF